MSSGSVLLAHAHDSEGEERVRVMRQARSVTFRFRLPLGKKVQDEYYVTLPNGDVRKYTFSQKYVDEN